MVRAITIKRARKSTAIPHRINELPDNIIQHILSFLDDTKSVVQTSVLSKRWRHIWKCVPTLHFDNHSFPNTVTFDRFVRHVLSCRDTLCQVHRLRFCRRTLLDSSLTKRVLSYAVSGKVSSVSISLYGHGKIYSLPQVLATCPTLETLTVACVVQLCLPPPFFATLTTLHLKNCIVECCVGCDNTWTFDGFAGMVNLKELCLEECTFFHLKTLRISGPQLLQLTMLNVVYIYFTTDVPFRL